MFLCLAYRDFGNKLPFLFLGEIASKFLKEFEEKDDYSVYHEELVDDIELWSNSNENSNIVQIKDKIQSVKETMVSNIDKVIERGEKLEILVEKTHDLDDTANEFSNSSNRLRNKFKMQWLYLIIFMIIIFFGFLLFLFVYFR